LVDQTSYSNHLGQQNLLSRWVPGQGRSCIPVLNEQISKVYKTFSSLMVQNLLFWYNFI